MEVEGPRDGGRRGRVVDQYIEKFRFCGHSHDTSALHRRETSLASCPAPSHDDAILQLHVSCRYLLCASTRFMYDSASSSEQGPCDATTETSALRTSCELRPN
jgi:hypothetical protein